MKENKPCGKKNYKSMDITKIGIPIFKKERKLHPKSEKYKYKRKTGKDEITRKVAK
jgi:hypothetical protein